MRSAWVASMTVQAGLINEGSCFTSRREYDGIIVVEYCLTDSYRLVVLLLAGGFITDGYIELLVAVVSDGFASKVEGTFLALSVFLVLGDLNCLSWFTIKNVKMCV